MNEEEVLKEIGSFEPPAPDGYKEVEEKEWFLRLKSGEDVLIADGVAKVLNEKIKKNEMPKWVVLNEVRSIAVWNIAEVFARVSKKKVGIYTNPEKQLEYNKYINNLEKLKGGKNAN